MRRLKKVTGNTAFICDALLKKEGDWIYYTLQKIYRRDSIFEQNKKQNITTEQGFDNGGDF